MKLSLKLIFTTILATLVAAPSYAESYTLEGVVYELVEDGTAEIVGYTDELPGRLTVPEQIPVDDDTYTVTAVRDSAFLNSNLWWIDLPATIRSIGSAAFLQPDGNWELDIMFLRSTVPPVLGEYVFFPNENEQSTQVYVDDRYHYNYIQDPRWAKTQLRKGFAYEINGLYYRILDREAMTAELIPIPRSKNLSYFLGYDNVPERLPDIVEIEGESYQLISIGDYAFKNSKVYNLKVQKTINNIGYCAFYLSFLETIYFEHTGEEIINLGLACFHSTHIEEIEIPESVEILSTGMFRQCPLLKITLPSTIRRIEDDAFYAETVIVKAMLPPYLDNPYSFSAFRQEGCTLYVPKGTIQAYSEAEGWREFHSIVEIESAIDGVEADAGERLTVRGEVYSSAGALLRSVSDPQGVTAAGCCEGLPAGVYVVRLTDTAGRMTAVRTAIR